MLNDKLGVDAGLFVDFISEADTPVGRMIHLSRLGVLGCFRKLALMYFESCSKFLALCFSCSNRIPLRVFRSISFCRTALIFSASVAVDHTHHRF